MKVRLTKEIESDKGEFIPPGTEIERPDADWLMRLDVAEPVDDEAKAAWDVIEAARSHRRKKLERLAAERMESQKRLDALMEAQAKKDEQERLDAFEALLKEGPNESA